MKETRAWPLLALAAAFLLAGSSAAWAKWDNEQLSYALAAAGLILVGVWVAIEVTRIAHAAHDKGLDEDEAPPE